MAFVIIRLLLAAIGIASLMLAVPFFLIGGAACLLAAILGPGRGAPPPKAPADSFEPHAKG